MSLTLGLSTALSGLNASRRGVDLVSNNISNINTPGFSRKFFNPKSRVLDGRGVGVEVAETTRQVDERLRKSLWKASGSFRELESKQLYFDRLQDLFGKPGENTTIAHAINELSVQFEQAAINPNQNGRTVRKMQDIALQFNSLSDTIQELRATADQEISANIQIFNEAIANMAVLNERITLASATGQGTADLRDQRDFFLGQVSEIMDVQYFERDDGALIMYTASGVNLLDSVPKEVVFNPASQVSPTDTFASGQFSKMLVGILDVTDDIKQGKLKSLREMRDEELPNLQSQIDELSTKLRLSLNEVHNRGTSFPTVANAMTGSRTFLPQTGGGTNYNQTIALKKGDVALTIFNKDGSQNTTTSLNTIMTSATLLDDGTGTGAGTGYPSDGPWAVGQVATRMQSWLRSNPGPNLANATVNINNDGKFDITLNTAQVSLGFRDQVDPALGATVEDVTIEFDANADGTTDETVKGFANFFGLNDLFHKGTNDRIWDSAALPGDHTVIGSATLQFSSTDDGFNFATVSILPGDTLERIAERINNTPTFDEQIVASVIPDGTGFRLRLSNLGTDQIAVTSTGSNTATDPLNLSPSQAGNAQNLIVNPSLVFDPSRLHRGKVQFNDTTIQYYVSEGDNSLVNAIAKTFTTPQTYEDAGGLVTGDLKLTDYGAAIVSQTSGRASSTESSVNYQRGLYEALQLKDAQISQVNMDEELSQLMIFEQSYSASAKVISTIKQMLDILGSIIR